MAGIGFELKKAINSERPLRRADGYISAGFTAGGSILTGILIAVFLQYAANLNQVDKTVSDRFMCYVTVTMFASMLLTSIITMPTARYVADKLYLKEREKVMPSLLGTSFFAIFPGMLLFTLIMILSGISVADNMILLLLFSVLSNCWILMGYVSLVRNYRRIMTAYLAAFLTALLLVRLLCLTDLFCVWSMLGVLIMTYAVVDAVLFAALYQQFPVAKGSVLEFMYSLRKYPCLPVIGLSCMLGMLGHFIIDWMCSENATVVGGLFRFDATYDFPAILAYCSTIPAMCYFVTFF